MNERWVEAWVTAVIGAGVVFGFWLLHLSSMRGDFIHYQQAQIDSLLAAQKEDHQQEIRLECLHQNRIWQSDMCLPSPLPPGAK